MSILDEGFPGSFHVVVVVVVVLLPWT